MTSFPAPEDAEATAPPNESRRTRVQTSTYAAEAAVATVVEDAARKLHRLRNSEEWQLMHCVSADALPRMRTSGEMAAETAGGGGDDARTNASSQHRRRRRHRSDQRQRLAHGG